MLSQPPPSSLRTRYFIGLDVHRDSIVSCVYDADLRCSCDEREFSAHKPKHLSRFVESMRSKYGDFRCCYEASFCGTALYEALTALGGAFDRVLYSGFGVEICAESDAKSRGADEKPPPIENAGRSFFA